MIFVDTSGWVAYFRGDRPDVITHLNGLLDEDRCALGIPVRLELLSGVRKRDESQLKRVLSALPTYRPSPEVWDRIERWVGAARDRGLRFGIGDLLIAAIVAEHQGGAVVL